MRITSQNLDATVQLNREIEQEVKKRILFMERYFQPIRILSPEKQALQILKEHNLIQMPIPDQNWGGAIFELPNGNRIPVVNTAQPRLYQYFICWHEVYHLTEESNFVATHNISTELDLTDRKADFFASQMLLSADLYSFYQQVKSNSFVDRIAYCMDAFKAPYKAVLIQLYESGLASNDLPLQREIKNNFDYHASQEEWVKIFERLALDESLVRPTNIVDFGKLKAAVLEKSEKHPDVELYTENQEFVLKLEQKFRRIKEGLDDGKL